MSHARRTTWLLISVGALLSGCASGIGNVVSELDGLENDIELTDVPFFSQVTDQCGPAALASILNDAGVATTAEELKPRVYIPERRGALQLELMAATRHFGRIPYEIDPSPLALVEELAAGRPVLVLQNLGLSMAPVWHYAVVVGYLPAERQFVLRSGSNERFLTDARSFARTWKRGDFWAMVALEPGELPANVVEDRYLQSVAATEATSEHGSVVPAYQVATQRWPDSNIAWLGLGNALYAEGEVRDAGGAYRQTLELQPDNVIAMNNLSQVYLRLGCRDGALETVNTALSGVGEHDPLRPYLLTTRQEVQESGAGPSCQL